MSFSSKVKLELINNYTTKKHCNTMEIYAILSNCGVIFTSNNKSFYLQTDNLFISKRYFILLSETFNITGEVLAKTNIKLNKSNFIIKVTNKEDTKKILEVINLLNINKTIMDDCCKKSFLRISFLINGSITDPTKNYHLELVSNKLCIAKILSNILNSYKLNAKIIERKGYYVTYIKEGENIVDFLNIIGAHNSLMGFENIRILKDISNNVNRKVNCETANISKTINAAVKQEEDIRFILKIKGYSYLPFQLQEVANLRLLHPDATLKEIGQMLTPNISKSGVNHRLRKISDIAKNLRRDIH